MTSGGGSDNYADRRQFGRRQTCWHAWIICPSRPRMACVVRNISQGGAMLELAVPPWLPYNFRLVVDSYDLDFPCEIRYKRPTVVGVLFDRLSKPLTELQKASLDDLREWTSGGVALGRRLPALDY